MQPSFVVLVSELSLFDFSQHHVQVHGATATVTPTQEYTPNTQREQLGCSGVRN